MAEPLRAQEALSTALRASLGLALLLVVVGLPLRAQDGVRVIPRLSGPVVLDGTSDEPAWETIAPLPAQMHELRYGEEPSHPTEFRGAHDGEYLYYSCRNYDSNPELIRDLPSSETERAGTATTVGSCWTRRMTKRTPSPS